ncbi:MAG: M36 family metallopeptidase [Myxococcota bacterium]
MKRAVAASPAFARRAVALLPLAVGVASWACGDDAGQGTSADSATSADASDASDDAGADAATDISAEPDTALGPGQARVYRVDPIVTPELETVTLAHLTPPYGALTGPYARVRSCTPDLERGKQTSYQLQNGTMNIVSCVPEQKALPDADGSYASIVPPATPADDDGRFAELMMYHHMQVIHDYYKDFYGLTDRDQPLEALTNVETWVDQCDDWEGIANAAFVPQAGLDYFVTGLDVSDIHGDAILFSGTADKNFSLDASVIYHEYTHAMLGATRLSGVFLDDQGINNLPGALNEGYADYFAATQTGEPTIGTYALTDLAEVSFCGASDTGTVVAENYSRDLRDQRHCPDDLTAEVHADSEIFSTALWAMRDALGKLKADSIALYAVVQLTNESDFDAAASYTIAAAKELYGPEDEATVRAIFEARNLVDCGRVVPIEKVGQAELTLRLEGTRILDLNPPRATPATCSSASPSPRARPR